MYMCTLHKNESRSHPGSLKEHHYLQALPTGRGYGLVMTRLGSWNSWYHLGKGLLLRGVTLIRIPNHLAPNQLLASGCSSSMSEKVISILKGLDLFVFVGDLFFFTDSTMGSITDYTTILGEVFLGFQAFFAKPTPPFFEVMMVATELRMETVVMRRLEEMSETDGTRQRDRWRDPWTRNEKNCQVGKKIYHICD